MVVAALLALLGSGHRAPAQTNVDVALLFSDSFNRPDSFDLSAATDGMEGMFITDGILTASNVWLEPVDLATSTPGDARVATSTLRMGGNGHTVHIILNHNLADYLADLDHPTTVSITLKLNGTPGPNDSSATHRFQGIGVGFSLNQGNTDGDRVLNRVADLFVAATANGLIRINDELASTRPGGTGAVTPTATIALNTNGTFVPGTLRLDLALAGAAIGSTVGYKVLFDAGSTGEFITLTNRSFVLANDSQLFVGIENRSTPAVFFDDFTVSTRDEYEPPPAAPAGVRFVPTLTNSMVGGNLRLSWSGDYAGWKLQVQTNSLTGTNWFDVAGSENVTTTNLPLNASHHAVYYRLYHPSVYLGEGLRVLNILNTRFYDAGTGRYVESINTVTLNKSASIYCWGAAYMVNVLAVAGMSDPRYDPRLASFINQLSWYVNGPGYGSTRNGQRFFDDNSILATSLMQAWSRRLRTQSVLDKANFALNYVFTNRDERWGLPQTEAGLGQGKWTTGIASSQVKARLMNYTVTLDQNAWYIATNYWAMLNEAEKGIKKPGNLYIYGTTWTNGAWVPNSVGPRAAQTLGVMDNAIMLYKLTGDTNYLALTIEMADAVLDRWYKPGGGFHELHNQGAAGAVARLCELHEVTGDMKWYNAAKDICDYLMNKCRDKGGYYPTGTDGYWDVDRSNEDPPTTVNAITQAAAALALLRFGYLEMNKDFVHLENQATARWLEEATTVNDGTGMGRNVRSVISTNLTSKTQWRFVPVPGQPGFFRVENRASGYWLECTSTPDVTQGQPSPTADADTLAVRAVEQTHTGASTSWQKVDAGNGYYFLQNQHTGYRLQATTLADTDGPAGGWQIRAQPQTRTDSTVCFRDLIQ